MSPAPFKQIDVTRAIKGARAAEMEIGAAYIDRDGNILLLAKGEEPMNARQSIDKMLGIR